MDLRNKEFIDAVFTSPKRDTIEVIWGNPDKSEMYQEYVEVDPNSATYNEVLKAANWNFENIIDATAERNKQGRKAFELAAVKIGQEEGWINKEKGFGEAIAAGEEISIKTERQLREEIYADINQMIFSDEIPEDRKVKEFMFMTKLYLFDLEHIKNHKDNKTKSALRKSKTPRDMIMNAAKLMG